MLNKFYLPLIFDHLTPEAKSAINSQRIATAKRRHASYVRQRTLSVVSNNKGDIITDRYGLCPAEYAFHVTIQNDKDRKAMRSIKGLNLEMFRELKRGRSRIRPKNCRRNTRGPNQQYR